MILDSDVLIELLRKKPDAVSWFASLPEAPSVSSLAIMEVLFGARDRSELRMIEAFLKPQPVSWLEAEDVRLAATYSHLRLSNGMGILDALTAALAVRLGEPLVTFNVKHFAAVPNLSTIQPYVR